MSNLSDTLKGLSISFSTIANEIENLENQVSYLENKLMSEKDANKQMTIELANILLNRYKE